MGCTRKSYLGSAEIQSCKAMVLAEAISMAHSALLYQPDISTFFLGAVAVSAFCPLGIYINLGLSLSSITLTVKSHVGNHF